MLTETLALANPLIPFVSEEIYSHLPGAEGLLAARTEGPAPPLDDGAEDLLARTIEAVQAVRRWRDSAGLKAGAKVSARLEAPGYEQTAEHLKRLARLELVEDGAAAVVSVPIPGGTLEILSGDGLDPGAAAEKRERERARLEQEIARARTRLSNDAFVSKAPAEVVQRERDKLAQLTAELEAL